MGTDASPPAALRGAGTRCGTQRQGPPEGLLKFPDRAAAGHQTAGSNRPNRVVNWSNWVAKLVK